LKNADAGDKKWMNEAFKRKADTMRVLAGAVMRWNCSTCWIFHIEDSMQGGKAQIRQTIPNAELERLKKSLNVILEVFQDKKGRAVKIVWTRYNDNKAEGQIIRDTEGMWKGVLPKVSEFIREFTGTEGYNGNAYSKEWLYTFLQSKGKEYKSIEHMVKELGLEQEPRWFDRNAWGEIIKKAGVE
ncbi:MAG TPA: hypothetical protein PKD55_21815, partial [Bellilinea sp.]|nr:hypothetical protein [Bellilinea sp.]